MFSDNEEDAEMEEENDNEVCQRCKKAVYFVERGPAFGDAIFHKNCFQCEACHRILQGGKFTDHGGKPYCDTCYKRVIHDNNTQAYGAAAGEIDAADPLSDFKSKNGKLDIKGFSKKHNIPTQMRNPPKVYRNEENKHQMPQANFKIGSKRLNAEKLVNSRLRHIDHEIRDKIHAIIRTQIAQFERRLMNQVDDILDRQFLEYRVTRHFEEESFDHSSVASGNSDKENSNKKKHKRKEKSPNQDQSDATMASVAQPKMENLMNERMDANDTHDLLKDKAYHASTNTRNTHRSSSKHATRTRETDRYTNKSQKMVDDLINSISDDEDDHDESSEDTADLLAKLM